MKPQNSKIWKGCDKSQLEFLYFIEKQYLTGKYLYWHEKYLPIIQRRKRVVDKVIKEGGYYSDTTEEKILRNISREYCKFKKQKL